MVTADQLPRLYSAPPAPNLATYSSKIHLLKTKALPGPPVSADSSLCQHSSTSRLLARSQVPDTFLVCPDFLQAFNTLREREVPATFQGGAGARVF